MHRHVVTGVMKLLHLERINIRSWIAGWTEFVGGVGNETAAAAADWTPNRIAHSLGQEFIILGMRDKSGARNAFPWHVSIFDAPPCCYRGDKIIAFRENKYSQLNSRLNWVRWWRWEWDGCSSWFVSLLVMYCS